MVLGIFRFCGFGPASASQMPFPGSVLGLDSVSHALALGVPAFVDPRDSISDLDPFFAYPLTFPCSHRLVQVTSGDSQRPQGHPCKELQAHGTGYATD